MQENKDNSGSGENIFGSGEPKDLHSIESDSDTLEPFDDASEHREINADDPDEIKLWANNFQISEE